MSSISDNPEPGGTPVMKYIRTMEAKIKHYERARLRLDFKVFAFGLAVGVVTASVVWYMLRT